MKTAIRMPIAFMSNAGAAAAKPAAAAAATGKPAETAKTRTEAKILGVNTTVPMPASHERNPTRSQYDFEALQVGQSIGIIGRKAENLTSTVANANRKFAEPKRDANGNLVYKMTDIKDAAGNVTGRVPDTSKPETVPTRRFFAIDVDPKTDPEGATVRIFREK